MLIQMWDAMWTGLAILAIPYSFGLLSGLVFRIVRSGWRQSMNAFTEEHTK